MPSKNNNMRLLFPLAIFAGAGALMAAGTSPPTTTPAAGVEAQPVQTVMASDRANYDEVGRASWYGAELAGRKTASGEPFNPQAITAAHRSLPLPSFVEVTNLDSGRTILVRINDRGPFSTDRIIDVSQGAARQLEVEGKGQFPVRVRRVNPPEFERKALIDGKRAAERLPTPPALLNALRKRLGSAPISLAIPATAASPASRKPEKPAARAEPKAPVAKVATKPDEALFVQVGAFSTQARANSAATQVGGTVQPAGKYWRVRTGPYADMKTAKAALGPVTAKGYRDARITR